RLLAGKIALLRFNADAGAFNREHAELIAAAVKSGASAAVAITSSPSSEIVALNVTPGIERCAVPVVLAGARDEPLLEKAASKGLAVSLLLNGADEARAEARNVIGRLSKGEKLIVISTPQSGWFRCAAERGPGIALFLGLARWAAKRSSGPGFLFVSTS